MILQPFLPPLLIVAIFTPLLVFCVFQIKRVSPKTHDSSKLTWLRRFFIVLSLCIVTLGPSVNTKVDRSSLTNLDVIFVVDTTTSMSAEDGAPAKDNSANTRLATAKDDIITLSYLLPPAKFSTIVFNSSAYLQLPLTEDVQTLREYAKTITPEISKYSTGTSLISPLETLQQAIDDANTAFPDDRIILVFMSDGDENSEYDDISNYYDLAPYIYAGGVIGYGTSDGSHMKEYNADVSSTISLQSLTGEKSTAGQTVENPANAKYVIDPATSQEAISKINTPKLEDLAKNLHIPYIHRSTEQSIRNFASKIHAENWYESTSLEPRVIPMLLIWPFSLLTSILILFEFISRMLQTSFRRSK